MISFWFGDYWHTANNNNNMSKIFSIDLILTIFSSICIQSRLLFWNKWLLISSIILICGSKWPKIMSIKCCFLSLFIFIYIYTYFFALLDICMNLRFEISYPFLLSIHTSFTYQSTVIICHPYFILLIALFDICIKLSWNYSILNCFCPIFISHPFVNQVSLFDILISFYG